MEWAGFDAVLVRSTWDYLGKLAAFRRWISEVGSTAVLLNPPETLHWNLHKGYLLELQAHGVPVVPSMLLGPGEHPDWHQAFARHGELVLKPAVSAGSFGTIRVATGITPARMHTVPSMCIGTCCSSRSCPASWNAARRTW